MSQMPPNSIPPQVPGYSAGGSYGYGQPMQPSRTSAAAVTSLICGIVGCVPIITSIIAVITGIVGIKATKDPSVRGRGMAIAGLVLGILGLLGWGAMGVGGGYAYVATRPQRATANQFVMDVSQGNLDAASAACVAGITHDQLQAGTDQIKTWGTVQKTIVTNIAFNNYNGTTTTNAVVLMTFGNGQVHNCNIVMTQVGGVWKISQFTFQ